MRGLLAMAVGCEQVMAAVKVDVEDALSASFSCATDDTLLGGALRAGIGFPYECGVGGCGSCKFQLLEGRLVSERPQPPGLRPADVRKNKHLACISFPQTDCRIKVKCDPDYQAAIRPDKRRLILRGRVPLTPDLWEFHFDAEGSAEFLPGQYAKFSIPGVKGARSYSMSNVANPAGQWHFQIKRTEGGEATSALFDRLKPGDGIAIDAPYSIAYLRTPPAGPTVCIAGGSGLAPMVSILKALGATPKGAADAVLYYGASKPTEVIDRALFEGIRGFDVERQYRPVVSEADPVDGWSGSTGMVHEFLAADLSEDTADADFYVAGPPPMVDAIRRHLVLERGISVSRLHYDRFY